jgi:hypothetical protein
MYCISVFAEIRFHGNTINRCRGGDAMRLMLMGIGGLAALGLLIVSGWMNFRFGQSLGSDAADGWFFGIASGCADGMKAVLPFLIAACWRQVRLLATLASIALWLLFVAYSMTSSLGFAALNRAEISGEKRLALAQYETLERTLTRKIAERDAMASARAIGEIDQLRRQGRQHPRWRATKGCQDITRPRSRTFCNDYMALGAERARAQRAAALDEEIAALRAELTGWTGYTGTTIDPQVSMIDRISGLGEDQITLALTILVSLMLELGSGLGFFVVFGGQPREAAEARREDNGKPSIRLPFPDGGSDLEWLRERLVSDRHGATGIADLYQDYLIWCERHERRDALTVSGFVRWLEEVVGATLRKVEGRQVAQGLRLLVRKETAGRDF